MSNSKINGLSAWSELVTSRGQHFLYAGRVDWCFACLQDFFIPLQQNIKRWVKAIGNNESTPKVGQEVNKITKKKVLFILTYFLRLKWAKSRLNWVSWVPCNSYVNFMLDRSIWRTTHRRVVSPEMCQGQAYEMHVSYLNMAFHV